ncbi:MAG: YiiX/YebB-like N1pC/P60 family cysteine hydrolase [Acidobacteriota bacterium]
MNLSLARGSGRFLPTHLQLASAAGRSAPHRSWSAWIRLLRWPWPSPHIRPPRGLRRVEAVESLGIGIDAEQQLREDDDTLRNIVAGLDRLERRLDRAEFVAAALARGYFTPDEEDLIRQAMLAYRNYRLGAYEIIFRYRRYAAIEAPYLQLRCFLLGYAAALTLIAKSLRIIEWAEHVPLLRAALNAPDAAWGLPRGLFDDVLAGFGSFGNLRVMARAHWFWRWHRGRLPEYGLTMAKGWRDWVRLIRRLRRTVRYRVARVLWARARHDWRWFWRRLRRPVRRARHGIESFIGERMAAANAAAAAGVSALREALPQFGSDLRTGDILLTRTEQSAAASLVPGFWIHAAIYMKSRGELEALGVHEAPPLAARWNGLPIHDHPNGVVIEAMMPRVRIVPIETCLAADHVAVLRPRVSGRELGAALGAALTHLGKPYDFEFDFTSDARIVCTELVYRAYHRRGAVAFGLTKRLGRFTLTCDDIMDSALRTWAVSGTGSEAPFSVPVAVLSRSGGPAVLRGPEAYGECARIRDGWRPTCARGA